MGIDTNSPLPPDLDTQDVVNQSRHDGEVWRMGMWLPKGWLQWDGPPLVRTLCPEVANLVAKGIKRVENMTTNDWISHGVQGYILSMIKQGKSYGKVDA